MPDTPHDGVNAEPNEAMDKPSGWAANERDRLALGLDATPAQRLAWLEEMLVLAYRSGALPKRTPPD